MADQSGLNNELLHIAPYGSLDEQVYQISFLAISYDENEVKKQKKNEKKKSNSLDRASEITDASGMPAPRVSTTKTAVQLNGRYSLLQHLTYPFPLVLVFNRHAITVNKAWLVRSLFSVPVSLFYEIFTCSGRAFGLPVAQPLKVDIIAPIF